MDRCWAFTLAYQEAVLIPYWVRAYRQFCERVIVYVDSDTDDGTERLAAAEGAEVRFHHTGGRLDDVAFVEFAQTRYLEARGRAEWAIWADADEFVYHPRMAERLDGYRAAGVTLPLVAGYAMVADAPPSGTGQIYHELRRGFRAPAYDKPCVFSPDLDLTWTPGKHQASAPGPGLVRDSGANPLRLLHYRWLGEAWCRARNARNFARIPPAARDALLGWEVYPGATGEYSPAWYAARAADAQEVV